MGAGATTLAETPKPDLELSQSDSLSTFDSLAQSSTLDRSMSLKQSWHASYMQRSRSARIREDDVPHKLAISFGGSGRTLLEDDDDWIAVKETEFDDEEPWQRPKLRKGRLDESYRLTESGTILLRETTKITSTGFNDEDVSVVDRCVLLGPLGAGGGGRVHKALDLHDLASRHGRPILRHLFLDKNGSSQLPTDAMLRRRSRCVRRFHRRTCWPLSPSSSHSND